VRVPSASHSFPPTPESVGGARQFTRRTLVSWGADGLEDDVRIVASELATNALLHARTRFTLTLTLDGERLRLTMTDGSATQPRMRRFDAAESTTGRGLRMVAELAHAWGVEQDGKGKAVWCEFRVPNGGSRPAKGASQVSADVLLGDLDVQALLALYGGDDDDAGPQLFGRRLIGALATVGVVA
jgi:anti-sigma regulatory factor (Ser/Thr protein kinase)